MYTKYKFNKWWKYHSATESEWSLFLQNKICPFLAQDILVSTLAILFYETQLDQIS